MARVVLVCELHAREGRWWAGYENGGQCGLIGWRWTSTRQPMDQIDLIFSFKRREGPKVVIDKDCDQPRCCLHTCAASCPSSSCALTCPRLMTIASYDFCGLAGCAGEMQMQTERRKCFQILDIDKPRDDVRRGAGQLPTCTQLVRQSTDGCKGP